MAAEVVMPRLGWAMETGTFAEWLKRDGEAVQAGDILFTVETDKATQEVEAMDSGILRLPPDAARPGTDVPVGAVLAYVVQPGEPDPFDRGTPAAAAAPATDAPTDGARLGAPRDSARLDGPDTRPADGRVRPAISPRARRVARDLGIDWTIIAGTGRTGRIVERDVRAQAAQAAPAERGRVTPLARRVAERDGVDVDELAAQAPGKRITRADVETAASASTPAGSSAPPVSGEEAGRPLERVRRTIAERMARSAHTVAPVTLTTEADATELVALRLRIKQAVGAAGRPAPSYTDLLVRLVALALQDHPLLNSSLSGDMIVQHAAVHMGIAVDTAQGLLVPVVRDAHLKSIQRIAGETAPLIERARAGRIMADDMGGSTFTITNLGMYEIDAFTPIINLPECAILGLGRIVTRQIVVDEESEAVALRKMMALSLTFDHRVVDGAPAARFLQQVKRWVEQPYAWLTA